MAYWAPFHVQRFAGLVMRDETLLEHLGKWYKIEYNWVPLVHTRFHTRKSNRWKRKFRMPLADRITKWWIDLKALMGDVAATYLLPPLASATCHWHKAMLVVGGELLVVRW